MKKQIRYAVVLLVVGGLVVGGNAMIEAKKSADASTKPAKEYEIVAKTFAPTHSHTTLTLPYLATTRSNDDVKISSKVSARIQYIAKSGTAVQKGDTVVKLDDTDLLTQLEALNLNINALQSQHKSKYIALENLFKIHQRSQKLVEVKGVAKEQLEKETTNIEELKAGIKSLEYKIQELNANRSAIKNTLSYTKIQAPISGVLSSMANSGDVAMPGHPLVSISSSSNAYLLVRLPSDVNASKLIYKDKHINLLALNTTFNGLLEYVANLDESLAANQIVEVDIVLFDDEGYKLPLDAILNREGKSYVLALDAKSVKAKPVTIIATGEQGAVVSGVSETDQLVVAKPDILLKLLSGIHAKGVE